MSTIDTGTLERLAGGSKYTVYHRRRTLGNRTDHMLVIKSCVSPHETISLRAENVDALIETIQKGVACLPTK